MKKTKRERVAEKADRLVGRELSTFLPYHLFLDSKRDDFETNLQIFKLLFRQEDPDYRMALWNSLRIFFCDFDRSLLTPEEQQFFAECEHAYKNSIMPEYTNLNKPFASSRLRLRPAKKGLEDLMLYYKHLEEDGDFERFTNLPLTDENIDKFGFDRPYFFVIEEKKTRTMVGYVGIRWENSAGEKTGVMECEYYIFKPCRRKGYAKEALTALCNRAFAEKLYEMQETSYDYIYRRKTAKPKLIRAMIRTDNTPSLRLVESCGFCHVGTLHRHFWAADCHAVDGEIYELQKTTE